MPIWHQSPKLTPRYFLETPRLFGYPTFEVQSIFLVVHFRDFIENEISNHKHDRESGNT